MNIFDKIGSLTAPRKTSDSPYGDFQIRMLAHIIDFALITLILGYPFQLITEKIVGSIETQSATRYLIANNLVQAPIISIIILLFWKHFAATPGKLLLNLRVADRHTLKPPVFWRYMLRMVGYLLCVAPLCLWLVLAFFSMATATGEFIILALLPVCGIPVVWLAFDRGRRGLHDRLAGTVVIKTRPCWKKPEPETGETPSTPDVESA